MLDAALGVRILDRTVHIVVAVIVRNGLPENLIGVFGKHSFVVNIVIFRRKLYLCSKFNYKDNDYL